MLDWIESTGTQYIDTGITNSATIKVEAKMSSQGWSCLCGSETSGSYRFKWGTGGAGTIFYGYGNNTFYDGNLPSTINDYYTYYMANGEQWVKDNNGTIVLSSTQTLSTFNTKNIALFSYYVGTTNNIATYMRICYCKIWDGNTLVRDLIPVIDTNNVVCMYDKVSEQYFYNQGADHFVPSETANYKTLSYLESTSTQYINSGVTSAQVKNIRGLLFNTFGFTHATAGTYGGVVFGARVSTTNSAYMYNSGAFSDYIGNGTALITLTKNTYTNPLIINYSTSHYSISCGSYSASGNLSITISTPLALRQLFFATSFSVIVTVPFTVVSF